MKFFLFDAINRYKRWSESLDIGTILCNKSWQVFNDSGDKEIYIFQSDGSLIMSINGRVVNGTWSYIPANHSLVINGAGQSYMLHPAFMDDVVLALNVDGTQDYAFMIDENNAESFAPKSYSALLGYFAEKERTRLIQQYRIQIQQEQEKIQREEEESLQREEQERILKVEALREQLTTYPWAPGPLFKYWIFIFVLMIGSMYLPSFNHYMGYYIWGYVLLIFFIYPYRYIYSKISTYIRINKWKKEHPNDWRAEYL